MKNKFVFFLFVCFATSLQAQTTTYKIIVDIPYYDDGIRKTDAYIAERCVLDVYYPENTENYSTVVWFHGGGLEGGEKFIPEPLKNQGLCVVAVNYRLHPKVTCPKYIEDAAAAVAWVFENIALYGGSPDLIFVAGHSAGGYLTSMIGLDKRLLEAHGIDADKIAGLIPLSGQAVTHYTIRKEKNISETQPVVDEFAPLYYVRPDAPPYIMMTGDREMELLGRYEENAYLLRMMKLVHHPHTVLYEFAGYGHDMLAPAYPLMLRFIRERVNEIRILKY